jgi:hypothetical protein
MRSSSMITLFSERPELNQRPYSFVVSILVHGIVAGLVSVGIIFAPKVKAPALAEQYNVRQLDLHTLDTEMRLNTEMQRAAASAIAAPRPHSIQHKSPSGGSAEGQARVMRQMVQAPPGPQTLVQPDLPKPVVLTEEIPLPAIVIWDGKKSPDKTLVPPLPEKPAVANIQPSTQLPNEEQNLADLAIPATNLAAQIQPILASTTSPVVVTGPKPTPPAPVTTAKGAAQPTPIVVISLSSSRMANGNVTLPPVNESASSSSHGAMSFGHIKGTAQAGQNNHGQDNHGEGNHGQGNHGQGDRGEGNRGQGDRTDKAGGRGEGQASRDAGDTPGSASAAQGDKNASGQTASGQTGFGLGNQPSTAHITLPKGGQFGAVVVGSSLEEKYPETAELWSGRLSYTVYLHVGLTKSWILQYSLSRVDNAAAAGNIARIEAPWPYNIVRPNIAPGTIDADALMVHGFVNQAGRFEALTVAFPPQFAQTQFVLNSLAQWQFRPATQNGQNVKVEILLIIPEESE